MGKTTFSALLCHSYELDNVNVFAVDADPDANLASTLGFPLEQHPAAISELKDLIHERTGAKPGTFGGVFKLNPKVDDIPEKYCVRRGTLSLILMGTVDTGGKGCICPESAFLKALMNHISFQKGTKLIMDMEAGLEHLGRGTTMNMDALVVIVRPDAKSVETAKRIIPLWKDLGDKKLFFVGNEARSEADADFLKKSLSEFPLLGVLPESELVRTNGRENRPPFEDAVMMDAVRSVRKRLEEETGA